MRPTQRKSVVLVRILFAQCQRHLAALLTDAASDLRKCNELWHGDRGEGYQKACREARAMVLRLSGDLKHRLQDQWRLDPMLLLRGLGIENREERLAFYQRYLGGCRNCLRVF